MTKKQRELLHSSKRVDWCTSQDFVELIWSFGDVALDPCGNEASIVGAKLEAWENGGLITASTRTTRGVQYTAWALEDGLKQSWCKLARGGVVYVNSPYGRGVIDEWMRKCDEEAAAGAEIIALVPARTDTKWYQGCRRDADVEVFGRLTFLDAPHPAPFPSSVFYWGKRVERFASLFGPIGRLHMRAHQAAKRSEPITDGTPAALYHRVSTVDQDPAGAELELRKAAEARGLRVDLVVNETGSGANNDRPGLQRVLEAARRGDVRAVLVWKIDRFGRSALDFLTNVRELQAAGCRFISTTQGIDLRGAGDPISNLMMQLLAAVAEFERTLIVERTRNGLAQARARGVRFGRPPKAGGPTLQRVQALRAAGRSWVEVAAELDCGVMQARRVLQVKL